MYPLKYAFAVSRVICEYKVKREDARGERKRERERGGGGERGTDR